MCKVYGVIHMLTILHGGDPEMVSLELFPTFEEAIERSKAIVKEFNDDYGEDYVEYATRDNPIAIVGNSDVTGYIYIVETMQW